MRLVAKFEELEPILTDKGKQKLTKLLKEGSGRVILSLYELLKLAKHY